MDNQLMEECQQSFYRELYHTEHPGYSVVKDETTGRICMKKELDTYNREVYEYLMEHRMRNVPAVFHLWEHDHKLTVIEEFIQGELLSDLLDSGSLSEGRKEQILLDLCDALTFLHSADPPVIHRDIKAENVMITDDGRTCLMDFNAAKLYHQGETRDTVLLGTEGFAAPEQYGFGASCVRTDIYGMGALIKEMYPDKGPMNRVTEKAMKLDPNQRYEDVSELRKAIIRYGPMNTGEIRAAKDSPTSGSDHIRGVNIPGFRSDNDLHKFAAILVYGLIILFTLAVNGDTKLATFLHKAIFFGACMSLVDLYTDWTHLFRHMPLMKSRVLPLRIPGYILSTAVILAFWSAMGVGVDYFL